MLFDTTRLSTKPSGTALAQPRCCICGRFVSWGADQSVSFGDTSMTEPPDPAYYCGPCAAGQEAEAVRDRRLPVRWVTSQWERRAAVLLGQEAGT